MSYQYDLADFKRFLHAKNPKYRVDGLIFWQNRIPLPIDLFNRIFDEADAIIVEYINQVTASALAFSCGEELLEKFGTQITSLPSSELEGQQYAVAEWSELKLQVYPSLLELFSATVIKRNFIYKSKIIISKMFENK